MKTSRKPKLIENPTFITCPGCDGQVMKKNINEHLDACLQHTIASPPNPDHAPITSHSKAGKRVLQLEQATQNFKKRVKLMSIDADMVQKYSVPEISGLMILPNFVSIEEELGLIENIDRDENQPWRLSQFNGECFSKIWGVETNLRERYTKLLDSKNPPFPDYLLPIIARITTQVVFISLSSDIIYDIPAHLFLPFLILFRTPWYVWTGLPASVRTKQMQTIIIEIKGTISLLISTIDTCLVKSW